jgi:hypothetical protein
MESATDRDNLKILLGALVLTTGGGFLLMHIAALLCVLFGFLAPIGFIPAAFLYGLLWSLYRLTLGVQK